MILASVLAFFLLVLTAHLFVEKTSYSPRVGESLSVDICAYWSALKVLKEGKSPFDSANVFAVQKSVPRIRDDYLLIFWNPPWLLGLLYPVLNNSFPVTVSLWFMLNLFFVFGSGVVLWKTVHPGKALKPMALFFAFLCVPSLNVLLFGQLGLFITFSLSCFLWCIKNDKYYLAGLALIPATTKPHVIFLFWPALLYWSFAARNYRPLISLTLGVVLFTLITMFYYPPIVLTWLGGFDSLYVGALSPTLGTVVRSLDPFNPKLIYIAMVGIPFASIGLLLLCLLAKRHKIVWYQFLPTLICISLFTTAYSMHHDQSLLLIIQVLLFSMAYEPYVEKKLQIQVVSALIIFEMLIFFVGALFARAQHHYFWVAPLMLAIWLRYAPLLAAQRGDTVANR